jgi:arsenate reductase (thioredoxin)
MRNLFPELETIINELPIDVILESRLGPIQQLADYLYSKIRCGQTIHLNFICTHNSRRSQLSQVWATTLGNYFGIDLFAYSGGVEVTEFNKRAVDALKREGFQIHKEGEVNPVYSVYFGEEEKPVIAFSKNYGDQSNPNEGFAAVMTCDHADENCPFIFGAEERIPLRFEDPKLFDGSTLEAEKYSERSRQIAAELFLAFKLAKEKMSKEARL